MALVVGTRVIQKHDCLKAEKIEKNVEVSPSSTEDSIFFMFFLFSYKHADLKQRSDSSSKYKNICMRRSRFLMGLEPL